MPSAQVSCLRGGYVLVRGKRCERRLQVLSWTSYCSKHAEKPETRWSFKDRSRATSPRNTVKKRWHVESGRVLPTMLLQVDCVLVPRHKRVCLFQDVHSNSRYRAPVFATNVHTRIPILVHHVFFRFGGTPMAEATETVVPIAAFNVTAEECVKSGHLRGHEKMGQVLR